MKKLLAVIFLSVGLISGAAAQNSDIVINAYSDAIIDLIVLAVLGLIIFKLIRSQNHPKGSVKEIANLWAACGGYLGTLSAGATWHQNNGVDFEEFVYFLSISMLIFPTTAYILGLGVGYLSNNGRPNIKNDTGSETGTENSNSRINTNKKSTEPEKTNIFVSSKIAEVQQKKHENGFENPTAIELEAYKEAYEEVASSKLDIPIWSLCFANSESDEEAKRKYIRIRSESIMQRKKNEKKREKKLRKRVQ